MISLYRYVQERLIWPTFVSVILRIITESHPLSFSTPFYLFIPHNKSLPMLTDAPCQFVVVTWSSISGIEKKRSRRSCWTSKNPVFLFLYGYYSVIRRLTTYKQPIEQVHMKCKRLKKLPTVCHILNYFHRVTSDNQ